MTEVLPGPLAEHPIDDCSAAFRPHPGSVDALLWRGIVRTHRGTMRARADRDPRPDYEADLRDFDEVLRRDPSVA
jgi:hypothetical protein